MGIKGKMRRVFRSFWKVSLLTLLPLISCSRLHLVAQIVFNLYQWFIVRDQKTPRVICKFSINKMSDFLFVGIADTGSVL